MKRIAFAAALLALAGGRAMAGVEGGQTELSLLYGPARTEIGGKMGRMLQAGKPSAAGAQIVHSFTSMLAFGVEADYSSGAGETKMKMYSASALARLTLLPGWRLRPYALAGLGYGKFKFSAGVSEKVGASSPGEYSGAVATLGGGLALDLGERLFIGAEFHERIMRRGDSVFYDRRISPAAALGKTIITEKAVLGRLGLKFGGRD